MRLPTGALRAGALCAGVLLAGALAVPAPLRAQVRDTTARADTAAADTTLDESMLPREVVREVVDLFNAPTTLRVNGRLDVAPERQITGDVAVLNGPLTIAGQVTGRVVVVNADVTLEPTARIEGDLLVVGGIVEGRHEAYIGGDIRVYRQVLYYSEQGDSIIAEREPAGEHWWSRRRARRGGLRSVLRFASAHTYNRVEGLPVTLGPSLQQSLGRGRLSLDVYGVVRTADELRWDSENLGHLVRAEFRSGDRVDVVVGGRLFDIVDPVEEWHLTDTEVGLASFFLHRDYRDYFNRHGGSAFVSLLAGEAVGVTFSLSDERWASRRDRDPFSLFRNQQTWRPNPQMDDGRFHVANATLRVDTRNDPDDPWSGWYLVADWERGTGRVTSFGPRAGDGGPGGTPPGPPAEQVTYNRGFLDVRRYNRIAPNAQFNGRIVIGGWLGGDALPLQRRLSVGGPGTLPGYDFREDPPGADVLQCGPDGAPLAPGQPALCERVALAQLEYRGDLNFDFDLFGRGGAGLRFHSASGSQWVVFADAGRGWLVGPRAGELRYPRGQLPSLGTFRTDLGVGLDFDPIGLFVAKSVSDAKEPANFFVRVRRRF